jgi:hypothetical protein
MFVRGKLGTFPGGGMDGGFHLDVWDLSKKKIWRQLGHQIKKGSTFVASSASLQKPDSSI